jgi:hypothetical protein
MNSSDIVYLQQEDVTVFISDFKIQDIYVGYYHKL